MTGISGSGTWREPVPDLGGAGRRVGRHGRTSPGRAGIGALQELHVGEDVAEMLGVDAALAALVGEAARPGSSASPRSSTSRTVASQAGLRLAGFGAMPAAATASSFSSARNISPV